MAKFCIIDASGYLFRAYHALPPLSTSKGEPVGALYGFLRMVSKVLKTEKPEYVAVCFDTPEETFRHEVYKDYKANREEPDDDIIAQLPVAEELVEAWGLSAFKKEGFEADDCIATIAKKAEKGGLDVLILSGDKDILQLVNKKIHVRDEMRKKEYDEAMVKERYGLRPDQLVDMLSLMGDKVDNVIGIPGVGEKTASLLLQENDNLENLFEKQSGAKPAIKAKLPEYKDRIIKNRELIRLRDDIPLDRDLEAFKVKMPDPQSFSEFLKRLEFKGDYVIPNGSPVSQGTPAKNRKVHTILTVQELSLLKSRLLKASHVAYDLETDSPNPHLCRIVGISFSIQPDEAWYIPIGHQYEGAPNQLRWDEVKNELGNVWEDKKIIKVGQNLKFDNTILERYGVALKGPFFDTMIAAYCLDPIRPSYGLKDLALTFLDERMIKFEEVVGKGKEANMSHVPVPDVATYAGADAEVTLRLASLFEGELKEKKLGPLFNELEMPLVQVIQDMESAGIRVDVPYLKEVGKRFEKKREVLEKEVFKLAGEEFKLNSPKQLSHILFEKLKLPVVKKTKTGFSTNEAVLSKLAEKHPICHLILSYRELAKLVSTYVDSLLELVDGEQKIHTSFHQTGTATGRLSSTGPNLQNIPIRTENGREIRKAFIASPGNVLVSIDYSQIDLRALAHMSEDPNLIQAFKSGGDIHARTAAEVFHVDVKNVTSDMRQKAKAINFGIVYGQQAWALSQSLRISVDEAQDFIDQYFLRYAGVKKWIDQTLEDARKNGHVTTLSGRVRRVDDILAPNMNARGFAERIAMNTPIQGTSADIIKAAMIKVWTLIKKNKYKTTMPVQVHDELLFDVPKNEAETLIPLIKKEMENAIQLKVPLVTDVKIGPNWNDMNVSH